MSEWEVAWEVRVHGTCTVEAETAEDAQAKVEGGEGGELENICEMLGPVEVTEVRFFQ